MKKLISSMAVVVCAVCCAGLTNAQTPGGNIVKNPGFEEYDPATRMPANWRTWIASGKPAFSVDDKTAHQGKCSLKITGDSTDARGVMVQEVYAAAGQYELSVWIKTENLAAKGGDYNEGVVLSYTAGGKRIHIERPDLKGTHDWTEVRKTINFPGASDLGLWIWCSSGTVWWDDVKLTPGSGDTREAAPPAVQAPAQTGVNLLKNGGFETADPANANQPEGWKTVGPVAWAEEGHAGNRCVVAKASAWALWQQELVLQPGVKYIFGGWMKSAGGDATAQVVFSDTKPTGYNKHDKYLKIGPDWKYYQAEFTPAEVTRTPARLWLLNEGQKTDLCFDDVSLVAATTAAPAAAPVALDPAKLNVNLLINSDVKQPDPANPAQPLGWTGKGPVAWIQKDRDGSYCLVARQSPWSEWRQPVTLLPGHKYLISGWLRADKDGVLAQIVFPDTKPWSAGKAYQYIKAETEWRLFQKEFTPSEVTKTPTSLILLNEGQPADLYFDDIALMDVTPLASGAGAPGPLPDLAINLAPEGDCETDSNGDGIPDGWHQAENRYLSRNLAGGFFFDQARSRAVYGWEPKGYRSARSLSMKVAPGDAGEWELEVRKIKPNTKYNLSFRYWQPVGRTINAAIFGRVYSPTHPRAFEQWMYATYNVESGNFSGDSSIGFFVDSPGQPVKIMIDDVRLCEGTVEKDGQTGTEWTLGQVIGQNQARLTYFTYDEGYVSPDMIAPLSFGIDYQFVTKDLPRFLKVNLDLPPEVEAVDFDAAYWTNIKNESRLEKTPVTHDRKPYTRYTVYYPVNRKVWTHPSHPGARHVFYYLKTALASGCVDAYYSLEWTGGAQPETKLPLRVTRVPRIKPSRFLVMEDVDRAVLDSWPGAEENLKALGINWVMYRVKPSELDRRNTDDLTRLKKAGFSLATWMNAGDTYPPDQASWALDINGKQIKAGGFNSSPCFIKRGRGYRDMVINARKYVDAGITGIFFDDEGRTDCFCADCVEAFQKYLAANAPETNFADPREFMKDPGKTPKLHVLWYDFSRWSYANVISDLRKEMLAYMREKGIDRSTLMLHDGGIIVDDKHIDRIREEQKMPKPAALYKFYGQAFDYYGDQIYINCYDWPYKGLPNLGADRQAQLTRSMVPYGLKQMPLPGADLTYMDPMDDFQPHAVMKCQLLELACAGISGYYIYPFADIDLQDMKYMNEALAVIQKVENIVMAGQPEEWAKSKTGNVRTLKSGDERLICVSEYSTFDDVPVTVTVECPATEKLNVIDVETGASLGQISAGRRAFSVSLGKERCKIFYVGQRKQL